jgi:murein DD-endopeptidase MepM/ murein hydrolase activator NlpD
LIDTPYSTSLAFADPTDDPVVRPSDSIQTVSATHRIFEDVRRSLETMEKDQIDRVGFMVADANGRADAILSIIGESGLSSSPVESGVGGPFIAAQPEGADFEASLSALESALDRLQSISGQAKQLPFGNPAPAKPVTSGFGNRRDPFLNKLAFHAGMDFKVYRGYPVRVTGSGIVTDTGRKGGYGNMVEVDHGNGIVTRYAHLSRIKVAVGQKLETGAVIGEAGSTGRSTGPHLHYEVRVDGKPVNPAPLIKAGRKLEGLLDI